MTDCRESCLSKGLPVARDPEADERKAGENVSARILSLYPIADGIKTATSDVLGMQMCNGLTRHWPRKPSVKQIEYPSQKCPRHCSKNLSNAAGILAIVKKCAPEHASPQCCALHWCAARLLNCCPHSSSTLPSQLSLCCWQQSLWPPAPWLLPLCLFSRSLLRHFYLSRGRVAPGLPPSTPFLHVPLLWAACLYAAAALPFCTESAQLAGAPPPAACQSAIAPHR